MKNQWYRDWRIGVLTIILSLVILAGLAAKFYGPQFYNLIKENQTPASEELQTVVWSPFTATFTLDQSQTPLADVDAYWTQWTTVVIITTPEFAEKYGFVIARNISTIYCDPNFWRLERACDHPWILQSSRKENELHILNFGEDEIFMGGPSEGDIIEVLYYDPERDLYRNIFTLVYPGQTVFVQLSAHSEAWED